MSDDGGCASMVVYLHGFGQLEPESEKVFCVISKLLASKSVRFLAPCYHGASFKDTHLETFLASLTSTARQYHAKTGIFVEDHAFL